MNTREATLVSDGKKRNGSPLWSRDGSQLVYSRVDANTKGAFTELYLTNPERLEEERILARLDGGSWRAVDFSPNGERLMVIEYVSANKSSIWGVSLEDGSKYPISHRTLEEKVSIRGALYDRDGLSLFITTDERSEFRKLTRERTNGGYIETTSEEIDWDVTQFELSPDGETLAFVTNEAGIGKLYLRSAVYSSSVSEIIDFPSIPVGTLSGIEWHPTKPVIGFTLRSANTPGDPYSVNVETGDVARWTYSETGSVDVDNFNEPEFISWKSFDGLEITGFLYRPPAKFTGKRPVLMQIHGGPEGQSRPGYLGSNNYFVQELGMTVIYPNVRGSSGYGKTFLQLDNGFKREDSYKDINSLLDWIADEPTLDEDNVVVRGGSYGGFMTLAVSAYYSDRIKCSVDIVGISNLRTFLENTQGYRRDLRRVEYGDERNPKMRSSSIAPRLSPART
ncbi:MAG: prolyl oligopeptidase family serine peptidase [Candidatus Hydrogenedentota bacterium]